VSSAFAGGYKLQRTQGMGVIVGALVGLLIPRNNSCYDQAWS